MKVNPILFRALVTRDLVERGLKSSFRDPKTVTPEMIDAYYIPTTIDGAPEALAAMMSPTPEAAMPKMPPLSELKPKTLIVWGRHDGVLPLILADRFEKAIPGSRKVILEDAAHLPHEEQPESVQYPARRIHSRPSMSFRPVVIAISAALMVPFFVTGCGSGAATPSAGSNSSAASAKEIVVDGSSTVYLISLAAQEAYKKTKPDARVLVSSHGTGTGFSMYKEGEVDIVDASRPAKPKEEEAALKGEMPWTRFHVGYDGITVVINPKNDFVKSLTRRAAQADLRARQQDPDLEAA